jgi:plastocyanin
MNGASRNRAGGTMFAALSALILSQVAASAAVTCTRTVVAKVVALDQAFYVNRFGALQAGGMIFALERDIVSMDGGNELQPGKVMVRPDRRPRPLTLRVDKGDCVEIQFHNLLSETPVSQTKGSIPTLPPSGYQPNQQVLGPANDKNGDQLQPPTRYAGVHVAGLEWAGSSSDDGTFVGANDTAAAGGTLNGLVAPGERIAYRLYAPEEGTFLLTSGGATVGERLGFGGQLSQGMFGSVIVEPPNAEFYRSQVSRDDLDAATVQSRQLPEGWSLSGRGQGCEYYKGTLKAWDLTRDPTDPQDPNRGRSCVTVVDKDGNPVLDPINTNGYLHTLGDQPVLDYGAVFGHGAKRAGLPVLSMLAGRRGDSRRELVSSDLTAIITGPFAWTFGTSPPQEPNETYPEADQPYREFAIHYHDDFMATQAFAAFRDGGMQYTLQGGRDFFAINYGMGAIGASLWANRVQMGPASECATCKFEEFFLSSWPNGDPAMVVDQPVNVAEQKPPQASKATKAFYPDDPSNVYHSYLRDRVKFRILNAGTNITHVHHQHAHQWLHSPKSGLSAYRDSQMISPGAAYTLDMVYGGSGNKNLTVGDSIFHCHFYPHFAQGMWALWRVHDVFERGTLLGPDGEAIPGFNRALPDGEIARGTPIPGLVPLPTLAMALVPARVEIKTVTSTVNGKTLTRNEIAVNQDDLKAGREPGYPFFVPGLAGQRAPHPPMSYAPQLDDKGNQVEVAGEKQTLDGGLPRNLVVAELGSTYEQHNRWDFSKDSDVLWARQLDEEGTPEERAAMKTFSVRNHPSYTAVGTPIPFVYNGQPPVRGGPFANPAVHYNGDPVKVCDPSRNGCNGKDFDGQKLTYKGVDIQTDVVLNKEGWHYPQQRFSLLWEDVKPTLDGKKRPEPLFFRANSGDVVEFWLSNLIPSHYDLDDFQVRTPTDVVGQHIHLVKFDVLASDGAANGFNYEEGTLAAEEVRGLIGAINKADGLVQPDGRQKMLAAKSIPEFEKQFNKNDPLIIGAQATVELWYADPLTDLCLPGDQKETCSKQPIDRTIGTVFTHDHFGPSTHQQAGLYAGLIVEPRNSEWLTTASLDPMGGVDPKTGNPIVNRADGGPTSWAAVIDDGTSRHREYALEFQDRQLTYTSASKSQPKPYQRYQPATVGLVNLANPNGPWGWSDSAASVNAPNDPGSSTGLPPYPQLITNTFGSGAWSLNYRNEPLDFRLALPSNKQTSIPNATDTALGFASIARNDPLLNTQPTGPIQPCAGFDVTIMGDSDSTGVFWSVNGEKLQNNSTVALKAGQVVCFGIESKTHGLLFPDQQTAEALFDIKDSPQASKFKLNPNGSNTCKLQNSYGTKPQDSGVIAVLRVLKDVTLDKSAPFECSQHCAAMAGMFTVRDALTIAGGQDASGKNVWFVDGKPMPNGETLQLKAGQLVQFSVQKGKHGLLFKSQSAAEALFDISHSPQAGKFVPNPNGPNTCQLTQSYGTVPQAFVSDGDNTIAELRVLKDAKVTGVVDFECSQHCANMLGSFALNPVLNVAADQDADNPHFWVVDGKMMPNGKTLELSPGQRVRFTVKNGTHGLLFADKATADAIFDIATSPQASKFVTNPRGAKTGTCNLAGSYGTVPQAAVTNPQPGDNTIAELVVKQAVTLSTPGQWMCSQHCQAMQGLFVPENTGFIVADTKNTRWLTNNEPLANNTSVPLAPGQKIRVSATGTGDQLFFPDKTAPAKLFGDASGFTPMTKCSVDGAGLNLNSDGTYSELTVKDPPTLSSAAFMSAQMCQKMEGLFQPDTPVPPFVYPQAFEGAAPNDPYTPLLRAYPGETVEIRTLVGAHMAPHSFNMHGVKWLFEQSSPNSGFRSTQGMGISEYYQMRFEVPATNSGADYLYASTSDTKGLEYGQWGLLRAYNQPQPDLPALGTAPAKTANVCASDAPPKSTYRVSAVSANQVLPGGTLLYNTRGLPGSDGEGKIFGEGALIYVNDEDLEVSADGIKMKLGRRVEPLVLRAAAGDCIDVTVTNRLPSNLSSSRPGSGYFGTLANVKLSTSLQVSLHPQQVGMDITTGNGVNIGKNPVQTVGPAKSTRLKWYAGSVAADGTHVPVELGAIGLSPADPLMQHPFGLLGALIIEPIGAAWHTDDNSRASATVTLPSGKLFREFVLVLQDDVSNLAWLLQPNLGDNFSRAINYATEPLPYRFTNPLWASTDPGLAPLGIARALSDSQALGDPQTPVLAVSKGTPTRLRVVHPGGLSEQAFALAGHSWQEEPFRNNSLEIGDNPASQWFGARDALGANDQFNIILNSAGGDNQVTGDYLYRTFIGTEFEFGLWGVMRVGEPGRDGVAIASVSNDLLRGSGYVVAGANTVNPDTGKMAKQVTITASVKPPDAIVPTLSTCTVPVDPVTGQWNAAAMKTLTEPFCPATSRGTLVVDAGHPVTVASSENGQASVTGFIPIPVVERILAEAVPRSSAEVVQTFERQMIQNKERLKNQNKELDQFLGERTPRATIQTPRAR